MRYLWPEARHRRLGAFHSPDGAAESLAEVLQALLGWARGSLTLKQQLAVEEQVGEERWSH